MATILDAPMRSLELTINADLADRVDAMAAGLGCTSGEAVAEALDNWLERQNYRHERTLAALADVDAGNVVDHDRVVEWVTSLGTDNPLPRPQPLR